MSDNSSQKTFSESMREMLVPRKNKLLYVGVIFATAVGSFVYLLDQAVNEGTVATEFAISYIGIVTFFVVLYTSYLITDSDSLDQGEVRRAIADSIITVYLALVPFGVLDDAVNFDDENVEAFVTTEMDDGTIVLTERTQGEIKNSTIDTLGSVVKYIIVFYFGSRTVSTMATGAASAYGSYRNNGSTAASTNSTTAIDYDQEAPLG